ncbi:hypothetical protein [Oenococcus oeni]|uniref:ABC-type polar amino acid transport system, ATPase component n=3 Tax=Oenococcus oeni TaxID=1247 RepID=Q04F18_OENOB|nr:hypothetical protein [Oenococcus oeni]ABJ56954.1 ABC-type polar amino acid transport system, ATPase component [Oenococcus oeni PSU-1]EFD88609.1 hypothetical protein AWRIB429_1029 [Oenococcus oeni AWRIB429]EJN91688.1 ABC-type polar amino acid transport system, ATPase component [Oenococcus oeni AWRIB304]EJN98939.1 ABC-type polar amino acid transport system, ATPase component [Oenococcus oeni AWRIB419]EJN99296.1 ABC-type polar amino acid transport system, ATPase component [Oenococcus oeni AWRIB
MGLVKLIADRIVFLEDGKVLFDDSTKIFFNRPDKLIADFLVVYELWLSKIQKINKYFYKR